tara:strand:- start:74632 stop:75480 length:849 start_codon:yes stop_codon:yes gene_type:complete
LTEYSRRSTPGKASVLRQQPTIDKCAESVFGNNSMFSHLLKAVAQINDPALRRVVLFGTGGAAILFIILLSLAWWLHDTYAYHALQDFLKGWGLWAWLLSLILKFINLLFALSVLFVLAILFPVITTLIIGLFFEDVVAAVEKKHYPGSPVARSQPISEVLGFTLRFVLLVIGLNLLCLPLYLILLFVPPLNLVLYYLLNGYLVSREYFGLIAIRHMDPALASKMRRANRGKVLLAGIIITFLLTVPVVNLLTPVIATAFMVHVFYNLPTCQKSLSQTADTH